MRTSYDPKYDTLYLKLGEAGKVLCKEVDEDIALDMDAHRKPVGIPALLASEHVDLAQLLPVEIAKERAKHPRIR